MPRFLLVVTVVSLSFSGCSPQGDSRRVTETSGLPSDADIPADDRSFGDYIVDDPLTYGNLTLFPLTSKVPKHKDRFITLDEGLAAGTVTIMEVGSDTDTQDADVSSGLDADPFAEALGDREDESSETGGDVNTLLVLNTSGRPLYLMPGEVIYGGRQDRAVGEEIVIASSSEPVPIDVYCVEQGRWSGRSIGATSRDLALSLEAPSTLSLIVSSRQEVEELAEQAGRGEFVASVGQLNKDGRLAVQHKGSQGAVWDEVSKANAKVGNENETSDFAQAYVAPEVVDELKPIVEYFLTPVSQTHQVVGVAVAVNGRMLSVDVFESTPLFLKFWPKLLKSYALDAVAAMSDENKHNPTMFCELADCLSFLQGFADSDAETEELSTGEMTHRRESSRAVSFSYYDSEAAISEMNSVGAGGFGGGGFGGAVHTGGFSK